MYSCINIVYNCMNTFVEMYLHGDSLRLCTFSQFLLSNIHNRPRQLKRCLFYIQGPASVNSGNKTHQLKSNINVITALL